MSPGRHGRELRHCGATAANERLRVLALLLACALASPPSAAAGQASPDIAVGVGAGGTFYCILSRCDSGVIARASATYGLSPAFALDAGARWHACFDCGRFLIGDAGVRLRYPAPRLSPFLAAGAGFSSDPEFIGDAWGAYGAVGATFRLADGWHLDAELRGRQVGEGSSMGELSVGVLHGWQRP